MADDNEELVFDDVNKGGDDTQQSADIEPSMSDEEAQLLSDLTNIEALANMSPEIRETEEYKNLQATYEKVKGGGSAAAEEEEEEGAEEEEEEDDEGVDSEEGDEDDESGNVFGIGNKSKDEDLEFEIDDEMAKFITDHYGLSDVSGFFDTVDKWRNQAQKGSKTQSEYEEIMSGLQSLPPEIKAAITAYGNNDDYFEAFNATGGRLDFDREYKDQEKDVIVKHYFTKEIANLQTKLNDGDLDDDDYEDRVDMLYNSAERLYNTDKKMFNERRAEILQEQEDFNENFKTSAISSVDKLKTQYPNFSTKELQKVRQRLVDGNIQSLFTNKDGTYTEEAAKMIAFALYGEGVLNDKLEKARLEGESKANETLVKRGNKKPRASKTQQKQQAEAIDSISHLQSQFEEDPYAGSGYE